MYDNLSADDIVTVWSEVVLDRSVRGFAWNDPAARIDVHVRLMLEDRRKRSFSQIAHGAA